MHDISIKYFVVYLMGATNMFHDSSAIVYIGIISQLTGVAMPSFARRNASIQRIGCDLGALTKRRSADSIGFRHRELNKLVGYGCFPVFKPEIPTDCAHSDSILNVSPFLSQVTSVFICQEINGFADDDQQNCW